MRKRKGSYSRVPYFRARIRTIFNYLNLGSLSRRSRLALHRTKGEEDVSPTSPPPLSSSIRSFIFFRFSTGKTFVTSRYTRLSRFRFVITPAPVPRANVSPNLFLLYILYIYNNSTNLLCVSFSFFLNPLFTSLVSFSHSFVHTHTHSLFCSLSLSLSLSI